MSLIDKLSSPKRHLTRQRPCGVAVWIGTLPEEERQAVEEALGHPDWETRALTAVLKEYGMTYSEPSLRRHRRGECPCARN